MCEEIFRLSRLSISLLLRLNLLLGVLFSGVVFSGCAPSIKPEVRLLELISSAKVEKGLIDLSFRPYIFLSSVVDMRTEKSVAEYDRKKVRTPDDVSQVVSAGLKRSLEEQGFLFSESAPVVLAVEIRQWRAEVESGFSDQVRAEASLFVEVIDPGNKRVYSGSYKGHAVIEDPSLDTKDVQSVLRTSMNEVLNQIVLDKQLMRLLSSY